ncbi:MAG: DNA-deoxyinosine glycosylase [Emergencia sp.]
MEYKYVEQTFSPVIDGQCSVLILGSLPSVKSRENGFYYGHPQNRFWRVLAAVLDCPVPETIEEKKTMLLSHHIAIYDVIQSCEIMGSSDSSVKNVTPVDIAKLLRLAPIEKVFVNGALAKKLYDRFMEKEAGMKAVKLPSTSPANAAYSIDRLIESWQMIK